MPKDTIAKLGLRPIVSAHAANPPENKRIPAVTTAAAPKRAISFPANRTEVIGTSNGPGAIARPVSRADQSQAVWSIKQPKAASRQRPPNRLITSAAPVGGCRTGRRRPTSSPRCRARPRPSLRCSMRSPIDPGGGRAVEAAASEPQAAAAIDLSATKASDAEPRLRPWRRRSKRLGTNPHPMLKPSPMSRCSRPPPNQSSRLRYWRRRRRYRCPGSTTSR